MPSTDKLSNSWPAWDNGYVAKFDKDSINFCTGCNYTTLIEADFESGNITLSGKTSGAIEKISPGVGIYDTTLKYKKVCYEYFVADPDIDLKIKLKVYSGEPDVLANPSKIPNSLSDFAYFSEESFESEEIRITPQMREDAKLIVGPWFICIFGRWESSYKLTVSNSNDTHIWLESGVAENGYIEKGETMQFYYRDEILKKETNLTA